MTDFSSSLKINKYPFSFNSGYQNNDYIKENWPIVYILMNTKTKQTYVGESTTGLKRLTSHLNNSQRNHSDKLLVITSNKFNKSATLFIESELIQKMDGDKKYKVANGNSGLTGKDKNFFQKDKYKTLFYEIWDRLLNEGYAKNTIKRIENADDFKFSPFKSLTNDQKNAVISILKLLNKDNQSRIFIDGGAGSGKTILAIYLMKLLSTKIQDYHLDDSDVRYSEEINLVKELQNKFFDEIKIGLVVPVTSLRHTLKKVFKSVEGLKANMVIGPTEVSKNKYDLLIVDESHRLKQRKNLTNYPSFDKANMKLNLDKNCDELDWIINQSSNQILFYDKNQSIRPSDIDDIKFQDLKKNAHNLILSSQLRVKGQKKYELFIDDLLNINSNKMFNDDNYELKLFDKIGDMHNEIKKKDIEEEGLCRMIAGFSWEWKHRKDKSYKDITIENHSFKWNTTNQDWINSENAINEIGCIHTTQGYDLNFCGVIFGREISYNPEAKSIIINEDMYFDKYGKINSNSHDIKKYILNIYKTMLLRGILGTYIYVCDKDLRDYFMNYIKKY